jgi:hypothetical protein
MAAGLGFKTFNTGDILTAADTNGYLMQGVWVFADAAARTSAVTSPQEGNVSFLKDTNSLEIYDGAAWVAYGAGDITGVTAGTGISGGGTSGAVTITNSMATAIDAKGDLIVGTGADTFDRLAVGGTNGHVLTVDSSTSTGLKWASAASGLTLVKTQTIGSAVTSVTVTNAFSASYDNYLITVSDGVGSQDGNTTLTLGNTTANYYQSGFYLSYTSSTVNGFNTNNGASWSATYYSTNAHSGHFNLQNPYLAKRTTISTVQIGTTSTGFAANYIGFLDNATSYTDFTLTRSGGTMTGGVIRIYGYQNS